MRERLRPRLVAAGWDYLLIAAWLAALAAVFVPLYLAGLYRPGALNPDVLIAAVSVLPVLAYLTLCEAGPRQATWGKRRAGLVVVTTGGKRPGAARIVLRNAVKLLPWQCAHMAVTRLTADDTSASGMALLVATYALAGTYVVLLLTRRDRATPYDLLTATRVVPRTPTT
ncbi:RDD family protein [Nonomuraea maritima]|uniref:RDD family protein n=1 Tax=Nonomuraea maritima TaxID=683260 RepID=A0A1G9P3Y1_9ACTN|nr:RDD family protein [Nonomuraea maritima]SDL93424.1 RDD family protein [Nonomuraea maritima]